MMNRFPLLMRTLCAAGMLLALGSCNNSNTDEPDPMPTMKEIAITVSDLTTNSAKISYAPSADNLAYFCTVIEKSDFDKFADDNTCIQHLISFLKAEAVRQSKPLEQIIKINTIKGNYSQTINDLDFGMEYVAYAVGINPDGTASSTLFKKEFTTAVPVIEQIAISVSDLAPRSANITYTPSVDDLSYFPSLIEKKAFDKFANDEACIKDIVDFLKAEVGDELKTIEDVVNKYCKKGTQSHVFDELVLGEEYVAYAVGVNTDGSISSHLFKTSFTTPIPGPSSNKISVEIKNIGADGAVLSATTTNTDPYIFDVWETSKLVGLSDEQIMDKVINAYGDGYWDDNVLSGNDNLDVRGRLDAETAYVVLAFGYEAGVKTTSLVKSQFSTKPGGWKECSFTFKALISNAYGATYEATNSDNTVPFYFSLIAASKLPIGSSEEALAELQKEIADWKKQGYGYSDLLMYGTEGKEFKGLLPKTDYYLCAVGMTITGEVITDLVKQKVTTPDVSTSTVTFGKPVISGRSVTVTVTAGANTPKWKACKIATWTAMYTDEYMTNHLINNVRTENQTSLTSEVSEDDNAAYFYGIGFDASGNPGRIVTLKVPLN